jgi:hypothetical protein
LGSRGNTKLDRKQENAFDNDFDHLYVSRKDGGRGMMQIEAYTAELLSWRNM